MHNTRNRDHPGPGHTVTWDEERQDWCCTCRHSPHRRCWRVAETDSGVRALASRYYGDIWPSRYMTYYLGQYIRQQRRGEE